MRGSLFVGAALVWASSASCSAAPSGAGGDLPDAATSTTASSSPDGSGPTTVNPAPECQEGGASGGSTWADLYHCYFGPVAPDGCGAGGTSCHATASSAGGRFWVCGATSDSCYMGMIGYPLIDPAQNNADPTRNGLYLTLCQTDGEGFMPLLCPPPVQMHPADMARVAAWIQGGAPEN